MVCEKIKIKKSASTLTSLVIILLIVIGMFYVGFSYIKVQTDAAGTVIPTKYNDTFNRFETSQNDLSNNVDEIKANVGNITEATSVYAVAWNGLKGLGNTLELPVSFVSSAVDTSQAMFISLDIIPPRIVALITIGIIAFVIFLVLSILKGDPKL
jgi:predicted PurR-regulated permease PerM